MVFPQRKAEVTEMGKTSAFRSSIRHDETAGPCVCRDGLADDAFTDRNKAHEPTKSDRSIAPSPIDDRTRWSEDHTPLEL